MISSARLALGPWLRKTDGQYGNVAGGSFAAVRGGSVTGNRPDNCASSGNPVEGCPG
jgi:hypothetical protein